MTRNQSIHMRSGCAPRVISVLRYRVIAISRARRNTFLPFHGLITARDSCFHVILIAARQNHSTSVLDPHSCRYPLFRGMHCPGRLRHLCSSPCWGSFRGGENFLPSRDSLPAHRSQKYRVPATRCFHYEGMMSGVCSQEQDARGRLK